MRGRIKGKEQYYGSGFREITGVSLEAIVEVYHPNDIEFLIEEKDKINKDLNKSVTLFYKESKEDWIANMAIKLIESIPYEYVSSGIGGQTIEPRHIYAARIAKEMAEVIFDKLPK